MGALHIGITGETLGALQFNASSRSIGMRVCVIGAGIVGLAAAWRLHQEGHAVTLVDREGVGAGASGANGAQLSYAYVEPLAGPGIWTQLPSLLLSRDSPLKLRPQWDLGQWLWGLSFLAACRATASREGTARLLKLAEESREAFERWLQEESPEVDFARSGKLVVYRSEAAFAHAREQLALQRRLGSQQSALDPQECVAVEPALLPARHAIVGAIHTPGECVADCDKVCQALIQSLRRHGASVEFGTSATGWELRSGRAAALRMADGRAIEADVFVVAVGTGSPALARGLGFRLPVVPLKGYSITLPLQGAAAGAAPRVSVTDAARKLVFARLGDRLRVAGMAELVGHDTRIDPRRIASLVAHTRDLFPGTAGDSASTQAWAGLRPATPTGLPVVGAHPLGPPNVLFDTGHGALGFTLAFASAEQVTQQVRALSPAALRSPAAPATCSESRKA
jgi:D-amino-acid dehydrogenase